jgi:hypothetical protein
MDRSEHWSGRNADQSSSWGAQLENNEYAPGDGQSAEQKHCSHRGIPGSKKAKASEEQSQPEYQERQNLRWQECV